MLKKILYIPLDERPCNFLYPQYIANTRNDVTLVAPPEDLLGNKKTPANTENLWEFVFEQANHVDAMVLSNDMLLYGGLLPSRLHQLNKESALDRIQNFRELKKIAPNTPIYGFNLIMRTPRYNSSDEEPDYYDDYGANIFQRAYLTDKKERAGLSEQEEKELRSNVIPKAVLQDYEWRRKFNVEMNVHILELVESNVIDFLSIPQDDSAEYGYTARDQKQIYTNILRKRLQSKIMVYPGADEVGSALLAKAFNYIMKRKVKVYPFFSSSLGPFITPLYEDRPMEESLKAHLLVTDCIWVESGEKADFILAINAPGKIMQEAKDQENKDITYNSFRQMQFFIDQIKTYIQNGKPVVLADNAFANGGEIELIEQLDDNRLLDQLVSYKGWNTNCNTLGTSIAAGVFGFEKTDELSIKKNLLYHILEDTFYQAKIRQYVTENVLPPIKANYFDLNGKDKVVTNEIYHQLKTIYESTIQHSFKEIVISNLEVFSPWRRMFEIGIDLEVKKQQ